VAWRCCRLQLCNKWQAQGQWQVLTFHLCTSRPPVLISVCLHREVPTLTERVYEDTTPVITYTRLASLYDVGNRFIARAENSGWTENPSAAISFCFKVLTYCRAQSSTSGCLLLSVLY
jgi:hypothetical protein